MFRRRFPLCPSLPRIKMPSFPLPWWPRKFVNDVAHLFLPFALAAFLLVAGGVLLATWGQLSRGVLVGFCVTAGVLVGLFVLCHLTLYCARVRGEEEKGGLVGGPTLSISGPPESPGSIGVPVKVKSPRTCPNCCGGVPRTDLVASQVVIRTANQVGPA